MCLAEIMVLCIGNDKFNSVAHAKILSIVRGLGVVCR